MLTFDDQPINNIQWVSVDHLHSNAWNPNVVLGPEFKLIKLSLLTNGWIQPILVNREYGPSASYDVAGETIQTADMKPYYEIIDGFHRSTLCRSDKEVAAMTGGRVPCAVMDLSVAERMMLTVRINRAKGTHQAFLMHELVKSLIQEHNVPITDLARGIGATEHEINTLMLEDVFQKLDIENHRYSKAWRPRFKGEPEQVR